MQIFLRVDVASNRPFRSTPHLVDPPRRGGLHGGLPGFTALPSLPMGGKPRRGVCQRVAMRWALVLGLLWTALVAGPAALAEVIPIGEVQGIVGPADDGRRHMSPLVDQRVEVRGVVTQIMRWETMKEKRSHFGFFLQNTARQADRDPNSSDGIFIFAERGESLGNYRPTVGDQVRVRGRVVEFHGETELKEPELLSLDLQNVRTPAFVINPPDDAAEADRYWERREGMMAWMLHGSLVQGSTHEDYRSRDVSVHVISGRHPVARRKDPQQRRVFRDIHPLDDNQEKGFDNGNGYRVAVSAAALGGKLPAFRTGDRLFAFRGVVRYHYGSYKVVPYEPLQFYRGGDPAQLHPPQAQKADELSIVSFNVENLYDFTDDPDDKVDFNADPALQEARQPYNYVPKSEEHYRSRLRALAGQILRPLHMPDLILVQEAEDQDVNGDGINDPLADLAKVIHYRTKVAYKVANDRDGADDRGIISAFMYRADRMRLATPDETAALFGAEPGFTPPFGPLLADLADDVENPKCFNATYPENSNTGKVQKVVFSRAPQVAHFKVGDRDLFALCNHFSSGPDKKITKRRNQAALNAAIATALGTSHPDADIVVGGDLNVFPRPDEPSPANPNDQLGALYEAGLTNLYDGLLETKPESAYTYVYRGQSGSLDHLFVNDVLGKRLRDFRIAHINADHTNLASDHDPLAARFVREP